MRAVPLAVAERESVADFFERQDDFTEPSDEEAVGSNGTFKSRFHPSRKLYFSFTEQRT